MFVFNSSGGASTLAFWGVWLLIFAGLFLFNEFSRRSKWAGFISFFALPVVLTVLWATVLKDVTYTDWFHLAKAYSATIGCIGFWCIRFIEKKDASGQVIWRLADSKLALCFPPLILAVNILEAVSRDIEVGMTYWQQNSGAIEGEITGVLGGSWNYMNAAAGILNIITITGWFAIVIRRETAKDKSHDMLWPDMLWFWIIAYDLWNFVYTYNCIPTHAWYAGFALLLAPTLCAFTVGKGAWLQHRAHTLAIWCMFAQTFPAFQDYSPFVVRSTYNPAVYTALGAVALGANIAVFVYMLYKVKKTKRNPYKAALYTDLSQYGQIAALGEPATATIK